MIDKIVRADLQYYPSKRKYKLVYTVHDENSTGEFGFIALRENHTVEFKVTEEKFLEFAEMTVIHEFMRRLYRIENDEELQILESVYNYR